MGSLLIWLVAASSSGADRLRTGEYEVTYDGGTALRICMTADDVAIYNGDAKAIQAHLAQKLSGNGRCSLTTLDVNGNRVSVTAQCWGVSRTETTTYHGDSYEAENSTGMKAHAKRVGACP